MEINCIIENIEYKTYIVDTYTVDLFLKKINKNRLKL